MRPNIGWQALGALAGRHPRPMPRSGGVPSAQRPTWRQYLAGGLLAAAMAAAYAQSDPWKPSELIQPKEVAARLSQKPVLFHVGFGNLYRSKHIPGSVYIGAGASQQGLEALRQAASKLPRGREIILYCGCCPWDKCPNMRPAFRTLKQMGFTHVRAMYTPTNFAKDWIDKGYPVEGSTASTR